MSYRLAKIASFYRLYLNDYYRRNTEISGKSYEEQQAHLFREGYGWSDFFSRYLKQMGNEAIEIIANAEPLQNAWARENNCEKDNILLNQLKKFRPDVVFFQDTINYSSRFLAQVRNEIPSVKLIIGHVCSPYSKEQGEVYRHYDLILTCSPGFQGFFDRSGIRNHLVYHAFEDSLLPEISSGINSPENQMIFIGSFLQSKVFHDSRIKLIESILRAGLPLSIYSDVKPDRRYDLFVKQSSYISVKVLRSLGMDSIIRSIPPLKKASLLSDFPEKINFSDAFRARLNSSPVFGIEMMKLLKNSMISLNIHGGIAGEYAANVRMFEVTGAGSLLVTDSKKNINELFIPGEEIITYSDTEDCISKLKWLLGHPDDARKIAMAGQRRTMKDHTVKQRVELLNDIILGELK
jgi:spore maturation protein CgeB